jgi:hypothetical protein
LVAKAKKADRSGCKTYYSTTRTLKINLWQQKNAYPDKAVVKYQKTTVNMNEVITYINSLSIPVEVKRATYVMFRNESANGTKGINNNYCGFQADSHRWDKQFDNLITGTVELHENTTNNLRRFLALKDFKACIDMLSFKVQDRGIYVGGNTHLITKMEVKTPADFVRAYKVEWVTGDANAHPSNQEMANLLSMYKQAQFYFVS